MVTSTSRPALPQWGLLVCSVALTVVTLTAQAEPTSRTIKPDPLNSKTTVPTVTYASSLKLDQRPTTDGPISWREANDTVTRIGGWRVYAREASQPAPDPKTTPAPAAAQAPAPASPAAPPAPAATPHAHGGHHKP